MPSAINAVFGADSRNFAAELEKMERDVMSFSGLVTRVLGFIGIGGVGALESEIMTLGKSLKESADRLGVSTDEVQALNYAADETGSSLERVANGLDRLAKSKETALSGTKAGAELVSTFNDFGISIEQIRSMSPKELFDAIGASISKTGVNAKVTADSIALMGRNGSQLIPTLKGLAENYDKFSHSPLKLTKSDIDAIDAAARAWSRLGTGIKVAAAESQIGLGTMLTSDFWARALHPSLTDNPAQLGAISNLRDKLAVQTAVNAPLPDYTAHGNEAEPTKNSGRGVEEVQTRRLELAEKIFRNSLKTMAVTEREAALKKKIADYESIANFHASVGEPEEDAKALQYKAKAEDLRGELTDIQTGQDKNGSGRPNGYGYALNSQQKIGTYAATSTEAKIHSALLKEIVSNTVHLKPPSGNHPPGTRPAQLGTHPNHR